MTDDIRWQQRFQNFTKALEQLDAAMALQQERELSPLEKQGVIQCFEYSYELGWQSLQDYLQWQGTTDLAGSRDTIREALPRRSHRFTAADVDIPANPALHSARVLDVLSSTPARPSCRAPCLYRHLHALASRIGETCGVTQGLIRDGDGWMAMLAARNRTSRTYNLATANAILESIRDSFHGLFRDLAIELEQREQRL